MDVQLAVRHEGIRRGEDVRADPVEQRLHLPWVVPHGGDRHDGRVMGLEVPDVGHAEAVSRHDPVPNRGDHAATVFQRAAPRHAEHHAEDAHGDMLIGSSEKSVHAAG